MVAIIGGGTGASLALQPRVNADEVPFMSTSYSALLADAVKSPYTFLMAAPYADQVRLLLDYLSLVNDTAQVALFFHDSPFGRDPIVPATQWLIRKKYKLVFTPYLMQTGATTYRPQLLQAARQGTSHIVIQNTGGPAGLLTKEIAALKLSMTGICLGYCGDEAFPRAAGTAGEGHMVVQPIAPPRTRLPGHAEMRAYAEAKGFDLDAQGVQFVRGWYTLLVFAKGLEKLVSERQEISGRNLRYAMETMAPINTGGVVGGGIHPVKFSRTNHLGSRAAAIYRIRGKRLVEIASNVRPWE